MASGGLARAFLGGLLLGPVVASQLSGQSLIQPSPASLPLLIVAGLAAYRGIEIREMPDVDRPVITVRATYDGATPETIELAIRLGRPARDVIAAATDLDDYEVLVVDDGSTDDTAQVAARHGVRCARHAAARGLNAARNTGIAETDGDLICFVDDDVEVHAGWLSSSVKARRSANR